TFSNFDETLRAHAALLATNAPKIHLLSELGMEWEHILNHASADEQRNVAEQAEEDLGWLAARMSIAISSVEGPVPAFLLRALDAQLTELEFVTTDLRKRTKNSSAHPPLDEWTTWIQLRALLERAEAGGRTTLVMEMSGEGICNFACMLCNEHNQHRVANAM